MPKNRKIIESQFSIDIPQIGSMFPSIIAMLNREGEAIWWNPNSPVYPIIKEIKEEERTFTTLFNITSNDLKKILDNTTNTQKEEIGRVCLKRDKRCIEHYSLEFQVLHSKNKDIVICTGENKTKLEELENFKESSFQSRNTLKLISRISDFTILRVNDLFCEVYGYKANDLEGKLTSDLDLYANIKDRAYIIDKIVTNVKEGNEGLYREQIESKTRYGTTIWIELTTTNIIIDHEPAILISIDSVDEKKRFEEKLIDAKLRAESASIAKSQFLANMSHEIRTPMNAILGFTEILHESSTNSEDREMLTSVMSAGKTLLSIINSILDLSKIEAGKMEIIKEPTSLKGVVDDISRVFQHKASQKGINLNFTTEGDVTTLYLIDETRIRQILFNLIGNGIKFTSQGFVNISVKVTPDKSVSESTLIIEVQDSGIGVKKDDLEIIFEEFKQQSGQSNRKYGGTGLGLAIVKKLTLKMGGELSVSSEINKGSCFSISIPRIEKVENITEELLSDSTNIPNIIFKPATLLVTDDVQHNIDIIKLYLRNHPIKILEANDGEQALIVAREQQPDLMLMDIRMPTMDGWEANKIKRLDDKIAHIPIIAFTASVLNKDIESLMEVFTSYLRKPLNKGALITKLMDYLPYEEYIEEIDTVEVEDINNENKSKEITLSNEEKREIEERLQNDLLERWFSISDGSILFEMEDFANEIKEFNREYSIQILEDWSNQVLSATSSFDIERAESTFNKFLDIKTQIVAIEIEE